MEHPLFEIVTTTAGAISIRNKEVNETMHNPVGPWIEANSLYIDQSKLRERLSENTDEEFVVYDVGLGAAANALAALACVDSLGNKARPFRIVSFEREMELLRFALANAKVFDHFKGYEPALEQILSTGSWTKGKISWELRKGDFLDLIDAEVYRPHLIFFDPYSPLKNQDMWTLASFKKLRYKSREKSEGGTSLYTYSQATRIRVSLILAGFYVGYGASTGLKSETTEASTSFETLKEPLDRDWHTRWGKSHLRHPYDLIPGDEGKVDEFVNKYFDRTLSEAF